jgi:hypothetical protein
MHADAGWADDTATHEHAAVVSHPHVPDYITGTSTDAADCRPSYRNAASTAQQQQHASHRCERDLDSSRPDPGEQAIGPPDPSV